MRYLDELISACNLAKSASPTNEFTFTSIESIDSKKLAGPAIYVIEDLSSDYELTYQKFVSYKSGSDRKCPRINSPSKIMYVGSSQNSVSQRLRQHAGFGPKQTYALNLSHWFDGGYVIRIFEYDVSPFVLQLIEDDLSHQLKPAFGKRGGNVS